jgi:hypothetical protein
MARSGKAGWPLDGALEAELDPDKAINCAGNTEVMANVKSMMQTLNQ